MKLSTFAAAFVITAEIVLNFWICFIPAITTPYVNILQGIHLAADYSAPYNAAYNFLFNPQKVYDWSITHSSPVPNGQDFRYAPFSLLMFIPFLVLPFQQSLDAFSFVQLLLLPLIALLIWKIIRPKTKLEYILTLAVEIFTLWSPLSNNGTIPKVQAFRFDTSNPFSNAYYWQWHAGQTVILNLALIYGIIFLIKRKPILAPLLLLFALMDVRMVILAAPVIIYTLIQEKPKNLKWGVLVAVLFCIPFLLYYNMLQTYLQLHQFSVFMLYNYNWIPLCSILSFSVVFFILRIPFSKGNRSVIGKRQ